MKKGIIAGVFFFGMCAVQAVTVTDDFDRSGFYSTDGSVIGAFWNNSDDMDQWKIVGDKLYLKINSDPAILYHTAMQTVGGDAGLFVSADVAANVSNGWAGMVFNYQNPSNYYMLRVKEGSAQYQLNSVVNGASSGLVFGADATLSFSLGLFYTLTVTSTNAYEFDFTITEAGGFAPLNSITTAVDGGGNFTGGYAGVYSSAVGGSADPDALFDNFRTDNESDFRERQTYLLNAEIGLNGVAEGVMPDAPTVEDPINLYGSYSAILLRLGLYIPEGNAVIQRIAEWFDHPHPKGRDLQGEVDFAALELARLYCNLKDSSKLDSLTKTKIKRFFLEFDFKSIYDSENHMLAFLTARYLMAKEFPEELFQAYGKTGAVLSLEDGQHLKQFIRFRARQGWGEFDSGGYQFLVFNTLLTLYDHSENGELVGLSEKMCNLMLADAAVDTVDGLYGGARGRVYDATVLDASRASLNHLQYLYFSIADPQPESGQERLLNLNRLSRWEIMNESLFSSFLPMEMVAAIATNRPQPYVNQERKHLHNMADPLPEVPLDGSIRKYLWYTPEYTLGCVQQQDAYPVDLDAGVYAKHQQHDWALTISGGTKTRIFTHHPGTSGQHTYWTGDFGCLCTSTFQNESVAVAVFDIPPAESYQKIHAYLPRSEFDEIVEDAGWIFVRKGAVFAALYLSGGYQWTSAGDWDDLEVISSGPKKASVLEVGTAAEFGSFLDFRNQIKLNSVVFDSASMTLTYDSNQAGKIEINHAGMRRVNDVDVDLDYPSYGSPYMQSPWDSGVITLRHGGAETVLDFN